VVEEPELLGRLILWTETSGSHTELLDYMLDATRRAYEVGATRWLERSDATHELEEVALRLLVRARHASGWFSAQDAVRWVGGRRGPTVLRHLNDLVRRGILESLGHTRAKRYRIVPPHPALLGTPPQAAGAAGARESDAVRAPGR
jgi:hypothetical protein